MIDVGAEVLCGPKKQRGTLWLYEDDDRTKVRVRMLNGNLKRWATVDLAPARGPRVPSVRAVEPEDDFGWSTARSTGEVRAIVEQPKPHTPRSTSHLAFVRSMPCAWCGAKGRTEASHHGIHGMSIKSPDYRAIPLCVECHKHHGDHFVLPKSAMNPDQTREWFKDRALDVCSERLEEGRKR